MGRECFSKDSFSSSPCIHAISFLDCCATTSWVSLIYALVRRSQNEELVWIFHVTNLKAKARRHHGRKGPRSMGLSPCHTRLHPQGELYSHLFLRNLSPENCKKRRHRPESAYTKRLVVSVKKKKIIIIITKIKNKKTVTSIDYRDLVHSFRRTNQLT